MTLRGSVSLLGSPPFSSSSPTFSVCLHISEIRLYLGLLSPAAYSKRAGTSLLSCSRTLWQNWCSCLTQSRKFGEMSLKSRAVFVLRKDETWLSCNPHLVNILLDDRIIKAEGNTRVLGNLVRKSHTALVIRLEFYISSFAIFAVVWGRWQLQISSLERKAWL